MAIRATGQRILVEQYEISRWVRTQRFTESIAEHDVTGMNQLAREFVPGFPDAGGELSGHLDHAINASGSTLKGMLGTPDRIWTVAYDTFAPGKDVDMALAALTAFRPSWSVQAPAGLAGSLIVNGAIAGGRSLQDLQALGAGNGAWVDWGASSTNGAVLHLHVLAITGSPSGLDYVLEDSDDGVNGSPVTAGAFATVTAPGAQRLIVPGTIRRYTRIVRSFTGGSTPTATAAIAMARR